MTGELEGEPKWMQLRRPIETIFFDVENQCSSPRLEWKDGGRTNDVSELGKGEDPVVGKNHQILVVGLNFPPTPSPISQNLVLINGFYSFG